MRNSTMRVGELISSLSEFEDDVEVKLQIKVWLPQLKGWEYLVVSLPIKTIAPSTDSSLMIVGEDLSGAQLVEQALVTDAPQSMTKTDSDVTALPARGARVTSRVNQNPQGLGKEGGKETLHEWARRRVEMGSGRERKG